MSTVYVTADKDRCIGSGQCTLTAPDVFDSGEDGLVTVVRPEPGDSRLAAVRRAASLCPVSALVIGERPPAP